MTAPKVQAAKVQALKGVKQLRADTAIALFNILEVGQSSRDVLPQLQKNYTDKDKAWLQEMVFGVLRQLPLLQYWLREYLDKPLKSKAKVVEHLIMLGFYQLAFSRVSEHAAVSETVAACPKLNNTPFKGLTNGVLRNFIRQDGSENRPDNAQIQSGLPKWLYKKMVSAYPEQSPQIIQGSNGRAPIWLRVSTDKISHQAFSQVLKDSGQDFTQSEEQPQALILQKSGDITQLPGFAEGWFAVQDGAAQLAAEYLGAQAGERVLDCCAAPGGKTCHILSAQPELDECVAMDIDQTRLTRVQENLDRLQYKATLIAGDAATPQAWWDGQLFDRILLDAPCSATGIIRRHPDIKWLRKGADIQVLVELQRQILDAIWPLLKPGGTLLYATCSILPEENVEQVTAFLNRQSNAELSPIHDNEDQQRPGRQIFPGEAQMDGFYYARLIKSEG